MIPGHWRYDEHILIVHTAESVAERLRGLIGRPSPREGEALFLPHCRSIHTFFMSYAIDVVFLDARATVVRICESVPPRRILYCRDALGVLEMRRGEIYRVGIRGGGGFVTEGYTPRRG